jgi:predicted nicotinamide N-methyase
METIVEHLRLAGVRLDIERPVDAERLIDEDAFARDEFLPYWAELWPSGIALAHRVAGLDLRDAAVAELGCGLGLPSLVAAALGARVTALDWSSDAIGLLRRNARRNDVALEAVEADWRRPGLLAGRTFDVVLAADVLYEERNGPPLLALLGRLVALGGAAWVADPGRRHAGRFLEAAAQAGWATTPARTPASRTARCTCSARAPYARGSRRASSKRRPCRPSARRITSTRSPLCGACTIRPRPM